MRSSRVILCAALACLIPGSVFAQTLRVTAPNDGSTVTLGVAYTIRWTSSGITQPLRILLFKDGERLGVVASDVPVASGSYAWTGGNYDGGTAPEGERYSITLKVQGADLQDSSDRTFALRPMGIVGNRYYGVEGGALRVDAPRAGETLIVGDRAEIRWTSPAPSDAGCGNTVRISAVRQSDARETTIAGNRDNRAGANSYSWYILPPVFSDLTGDYRIRISGGTNCTAESGVFALTAHAVGGVAHVQWVDPPAPVGPNPVDIAIRVAANTFRSRRIAGAPSMDSAYDAYLAEMTVEARIMNTWPSGAPIEVRTVHCHWHLEEDLRDGNGWHTLPSYPAAWSSGGFEMGPATSRGWAGHEVEIQYKLKDDPANHWVGEPRYRIRFDIDPHRALTDPDRGNNTASSTAFPNPEAR